MTRAERRRSTTAGCWILAGLLHFVVPKAYEAIVPPSLEPWRREAVLWSGVAEVAGGAAMLPASTRRCARWLLLATLAAVFPANIHMALNPERFAKVPPALLWARLPLQGVFVFFTWRATAYVALGRTSSRARPPNVHPRRAGSPDPPMRPTPWTATGNRTGSPPRTWEQRGQQRTHACDGTIGGCGRERERSGPVADGSLPLRRVRPPHRARPRRGGRPRRSGRAGRRRR